ncbi:MAG: sulfurtransferase complex subunit TusC [Gammaproteobacteria bacterium]|nr:sulfurtransferase complex subunit TusC [Gammaproteobacteria bacterium]
MKILFIFNKAPYGSDCGKELLDMALAFATFDQSVSLLFIDQGVWQLVDEQKPKLIGQKAYTRLFSGLDLYDIDHLYVEEAALTRYGIDATTLIAKRQTVAEPAIQQLIDQHDRVYTL